MSRKSCQSSAADSRSTAGAVTMRPSCAGRRSVQVAPTSDVTSATNTTTTPDVLVTRPPLRLHEQGARILDQFLDTHEEPDGFRPVDNAVVVCEGHVHHRPQHELAVDPHRTILDGVEAEDADLRR